ncbi:putative bifunctional diguanylate cyclase/phosphodiesterase [Roseococcus sp. DSY-14]|uniref:putative bifunctional diguanylate cyclase/phosphodiesterase n=1 Tax=Roseococcus sp. DSY-14 TaxID=3369650 RepID=UPI00387B2512
MTRHALSLRFALAAAACLVAAEVGGAWVISEAALRGELRRNHGMAGIQADMVAALAAPGLRFGRAGAVEAVIAPLTARNPELLAARFERADGTVLHAWARPGAGPPDGWWQPAPERPLAPLATIGRIATAADGAQVGRVALLWDQRPLVAAAQRQFGWSAALSAAASLALGGLGFGVLRHRLRRFRRAEEASRELAMRDVLTGLLNRRGFTDATERGALAEAWAAGRPILLALADLDGFKPVNDTFGHPAGDQLLQAIAARLAREVGPRGVVARLGGDEFALLAELDPEDPVGAAEELSRRVLGVVRAPIAVHPEGRESGEAGVPVRVGLSLGWALAPADAQDLGELMRRADAALYRAKAEGRGRFCRFLPEMDPRIGTRRGTMRLEAELRQALAGEHLRCHYQPIRHMRTRRLLALEALARWPHATRGLIPPSEFIPIAEGSGLIVPLTEQLLRQACTDALRWPPHVMLSFNLSPLHLKSGDLAKQVGRILEETGLPPERLQLELTEMAFIGDVKQARAALHALKALGVQLAIDDFGTRHSNLRELQALPFDKIKVDAGFVRAMALDSGARKIVAAVVGLGESLGMPVVAEGIEEEADLAALLELGCELGQGWLFGKPQPAEAVAAMMAALPGRAAA